MTRRLDVLLLVLAVGGAYLAYSPAPRPATVIPSDPVLSGVEARTDLSRTGAPAVTRWPLPPAPSSGADGAPPSSSVASSRATARAMAKPRSVAPAATHRVAAVQYAIHATWYCDPPRSRCTAGYPADGLYAAISPDLRTWTGRLVRVRYGGSTVTVRVVDCDCAAEHSIDLYAAAFKRLAPLSVGELTVTLELLEE